MCFEFIGYVVDSVWWGFGEESVRVRECCCGGLGVWRGLEG